jgi:hypothetical protein
MSWQALRGTGTEVNQIAVDGIGVGVKVGVLRGTKTNASQSGLNAWSSDQCDGREDIVLAIWPRE